MKLIEKEKAIDLRKQGFTISEIHRLLKISKGTLSLWLRNIHVSPEADSLIKSKLSKAQQTASRAILNKSKEKSRVAFEYATKTILPVKLNKNFSQLLCAMIYWCEGNKAWKDPVVFTNSDPHLVKTFLKLLRTSFKIDESKFRIGMHLHGYHDEQKQLEFWSRITNVSKERFVKTFHKPNTGKYRKEGYQGCISVRYYDVVITRKLLALAQVFMNKGPVDGYL